MEALSQEQLEIRKHGVTGSEIAAVAGLSPWSSPIEVWQRKLGKLPELEGSHHLERGTFLEEGLVRWLEHRMGDGYVVDKVGTVVHPKHDYIIATPDGAARRNGNRIAAVEIKSPGFHTAGDWDDPVKVPDGIPAYYVPQVIWEMAVLEVEEAHVAALIGEDLRVYCIQFSGKLFEALAARAEEFMGYLHNEEPPPMDHSSAAADWLKREFPRHHETKPLMKATPEIEDHILRLKEVREAEEKIDVERKTLENVIKEFVGDAPGIEGMWGKITWKKNKDSQRLNTKELTSHLKDADPELIEKFTEMRPGPRVFRPYWKKGGK